MELELDHHGAQLFAAMLDARSLRELSGMLPDRPKAGLRVYGNPALGEWLTNGPVGGIARRALGATAKPVRAILFDKTSESNWALGWHQDRTIAVQEKIKTPGFSNWTVKGVAHHVEPPFDLIERMITARIHFDPVPVSNAPLLVALGSHRQGRIPESALPRVTEDCATFACLAEAGDVWLYRTAIIHASDRAQKESRRRVLQVDFSAEALPGGLDWLGVG